MSQYRLHIDIPLPFTEQESIQISNMIIQYMSGLNNNSVEEINYRLGHDDDRQKSNYMMKNENGHVNNKKSKIRLKENA
jgi:hypothetical protein